MSDRHTRRRACAVVLAGAVSMAGLVGGCTAPSTDRAGGGAGVRAPTVVQFATEGDVPPMQVKLWADKVRELSRGDLAIRYVSWQHKGEATYEGGILADVRAGTVEAAWIGARGFDLADTKAFQALLAPFLVDSIELEGKVFERGIPQQMLRAVATPDLVPLGVLPGPLRRVLGSDRDFTAAADFRGATVAMQDSALAARSLEALGARPLALSPHVLPDDVDGYEQQLGSIWGNHFERSAQHIAGNVVLWPRPLVLVMGRPAFEALTPPQRSVLTKAADLATAPSLEASIADDRDALPGLCQAGVRFPVASSAQLAFMREAVEPVYRELRADGATGLWLSQIEALKADSGVGPDVASCAEVAGVGDAIPDGTYARTMAKEDFDEWPGQVTWDPPPPGRWTLTFEGRLLTLTNAAGDVDRWTYRVFRGRIEARSSFTVEATYALRERELTFGEFTFPNCSDCGGYAVALGGKKPWVRQ